MGRSSGPDPHNQETMHFPLAPLIALERNNFPIEMNSMDFGSKF